MNPTEPTLSYQNEAMNYYYVGAEILVAVFAVVGNALVIFVFRKERRLRRRTNYYIVSLAAADLLVGLLGIPFAILSSVGLPTNLHACLFTVSLLVVLCTISIFCLVAVSVDRYWAILYPMGYSRNVRTKTAIIIISICWVAGTIVGFLPLMGWHKEDSPDFKCFFLDVMEYDYLVFLYFGTIITPALLLAAFYAHIYQVVLKQLRRIVTMDPDSGSSTTGCSSGGTMLRVLGAAQKREVKATQNLAIIVLFFMICWIPLYTINCVLAFCKTCKVDSTFMFFCIILSHVNSAGNPLLYAYHLKDFRSALKNALCRFMGKSIDNDFHNGRTIRNLTQTRINSVRPERTDSQVCCRKPTMALESGRTIWNIPEGSDSGDSPKRAKDISQVNRAFVDVDSDDDVFLPVDKNLTLKMGKNVRILPISNSSPQLGRGLFLVETNFSKMAHPYGRSVSVDDRARVARSLSDDGTTSTESIGRKPNGLARNSCGS